MCIKLLKIIKELLLLLKTSLQSRPVSCVRRFGRFPDLNTSWLRPLFILYSVFYCRVSWLLIISQLFSDAVVHPQKYNLVRQWGGLCRKLMKNKLFLFPVTAFSAAHHQLMHTEHAQLSLRKTQLHSLQNKSCFLMWRMTPRLWRWSSKHPRAQALPQQGRWNASFTLTEESFRIQGGDGQIILLVPPPLPPQIHKWSFVICSFEASGCV